MDNKELLQQALEALTFCGDPEKAFDMEEAAAEALRARLAQPEQESADDDDQAWDRNAERLTKEAFGLGGGINLNATSIDDLFVYEDAPTTGRTEPEKEQEPVAWGVMKRGERVYYVNDSRNVCQGYAELYGHRSGYGTGKLDHEVIPLYTAPPQREWQGLTDEEIKTLAATSAAIRGSYVHSFARAIEAKLKEKNS